LELVGEKFVGYQKAIKNHCKTGDPALPKGQKESNAAPLLGRVYHS